MSRQKWVRTDYNESEYITPGKWYKVEPPELWDEENGYRPEPNEECFSMIEDGGSRIYTDFKVSSHLGMGGWEVAEFDGDPNEK